LGWKWNSPCRLNRNGSHPIKARRLNFPSHHRNDFEGGSGDSGDSGGSFVWSRWLSPLRGIHVPDAEDDTHRIRSGKQELARKAWAFLRFFCEEGLSTGA